MGFFAKYHVISVWTGKTIARYLSKLVFQLRTVRLAKCKVLVIELFYHKCSVLFIFGRRQANDVPETRSSTKLFFVTLRIMEN